MSILIIALPRTGSTSLLYSLSERRNLKPLFEPFDGTDRVIYNKQKDVVVKTIICHHPDNYELIKDFDEVFLLTRKNIVECVESHAYQTYYSKQKNYDSNKAYVYDNVPLDVYEQCYNDIVKWNKELKELSENLNLPIIYYENIHNPLGKDRLRKGNRDKNKII